MLRNAFQIQQSTISSRLIVVFTGKALTKEKGSHMNLET